MNNNYGKTPIFLAMAVASFSANFADAADKPNVLMIVLDDMNDYIGVMGGNDQALTPNIDRLAQKGIYFANVHSNCPVCSPSRASFMTGILPTTSGCWGFKNPLKNPILKGSKTIAEYAKDNGYGTYQTGKVLHHQIKEAWDNLGVKKSHGPYPSDGKKMMQHPSCPEGMKEFGALDSTFAPLSDIPNVKDKDGKENKGWFKISWGQKPKPFRYTNDDDRDMMTDEQSVDWFKKRIKQLEKQSSEKPFLIAVGIMRPHTPLVVPKKYFDKFPLDSVKIPTRKKDDKADCGKFVKVNKGRGQKIYEALVAGYNSHDEGLKKYTQAYLACVSFADDMVGQILTALDKSKFKDDTIVILFSDHGYHIGEKDELWKYTHWEESTRVPFIIKDPKYAKNAGKTVEHPISLIDIFPTIADLCGMTGPTTKNKNGVKPDGHSLRPFLENPEAGNWTGPDIAITVTDSWKSKSPQKQHLSARSKDFRYIHYSDGSEELYDHRKDPHEWANLADNPEFASIKAEMKKKLFEAVPEQVKKASGATGNGEKKNAAKSSDAAWKNKFFKKYPEADADKDGKLSWPEYNRYKKTNG